MDVKLSFIGRNAGRIIKMKANEIETQEQFNSWLNEGKYQSGERFVCKPGELRSVETQEEYEAVRLWGLSPEDIRAFFESTSKKTHELWRELERDELKEEFYGKKYSATNN